MNKTHMVFIYGTLKKGFYFHDKYLGQDQSKPHGKATTSLDVALYVDGMPHMIREKTDKPTKGELYEVNDTVLKSLDELEGHPVVYKRELIDVTDEKGEKMLVWAYLRPASFKGKSFAWKVEEFE